MIITYVLQCFAAGVPETAASVSGDIITVNGVAYDLSAVPDGGHAAPQGEHPFVGKIARTGGVLRLSLRWVYHDCAADVIQPDTAPVVTVTAGPVPDPIIRKPAPQELQA